MTPSLYDLLDVPPDAGADEIRAAWKATIADLDPTDRRFRAYNQAAEVLLDPERRAAYDAELAAAAVEEEPEPTDAPVAPLGQEPVAGEATGPADAGQPASARWVPPTWLLVGLAVVTAVVAGLAAWLATTPSDSDIESATRDAQSAAERAVVPVLSYDYRDLDGSAEEARSYLTSDYQDDYDKLFAVIEDNAPGSKTVVDVQVVVSGIVRSGEDRVQVLLFVNRPTTNKATTEPVVYKDQVTLTMERSGDEWLVDDMVTSPVGR